MQPAGREVLQSALDEFMTENPEIICEQLYFETEELRSNFQISVLGGSGPDLVYGPADQVGPFVTMELIHPLDSFYNDDFLAVFVEASKVRYNGNLYLLGDRVGNHLTLVYNRDILENPPQNTDELLAMSNQYSVDLDGDGMIDQFTLVFNYIEPFFAIPFLGGFGGWVMNDENQPILNTPEMTNGMAFLAKLKTENVIPRECDYDIANSLFKEGKAAMIINGSWSWGGYLDAEMNIGLAKIPKVSQTGKWPTPMVSALGYSININSTEKRLENSIKLLEFLLQSEIQLRFTEKLNTIPSHKTALKNPQFQTGMLKASADQMSVGKPMPVVPEMRAIWDAMRPHYQAVLNGSLTPKEATEKMQTDAEKKITEMYE
ncbi:MAG: extracellular solute-binding protein [Candidatus Marinimicrobia bacterium]|nr:extracellular solute-binding protein [Candidatus Neomarinimicrobiota bacterium]